MRLLLDKTKTERATGMGPDRRSEHGLHITPDQKHEVVRYMSGLDDRTSLGKDKRRQ